MARITTAQAAASIFHTGTMYNTGKNGRPGRMRKVYDRIPARSGTHLVSTAALAKALHTSDIKGRMGSVREYIARGGKLGPVRGTLHKNGVFELSDGNHRLRVARERGEKFVLLQHERARYRLPGHILAAGHRGQTVRVSAGRPG